MKHVILLCALFCLPITQARAETTYERVLKTNTLRCGYFVADPMVVKDLNTGRMQGFIVDVTEELAQSMDITVNWQQEASFGTYLQDINEGKYDAECSGGWPNAKRGKHADYTIPFAYIPLYLYARADDDRFDNTLEAVNDPSVRFVTIDGETSEQVHRRHFPRATTVSLPQSVPFTDKLVTVQTGKADVGLMAAPQAAGYLQANSGKLKRVKSAPVRVIELSYTLPKGDTAFRQMMNTAIRELLYDGFIEKRLDHYDPDKRLFLRKKKPYSIK